MARFFQRFITAKSAGLKSDDFYVQSIEWVSFRLPHFALNQPCPHKEV
jgi:hypothetical protein